MSADKEEVTVEASMRKRHVAWRIATESVEPIIEQHGLDDYVVGSVFTPTSKFTKVDQHLDHILRVADWFLEEER